MKSIVVIGGGVIGLCTAYYAAQRGHSVTVLDRDPEDHLGCSYGNAGMVVPSHFVPLAAPGAVALGIKWMRNPESPFWVKPRIDWDLIHWGLKFWRASNPSHVARSAPLLCSLHTASRTLFKEVAARAGENGAFGLVEKGLLMLCKTQHTFDEEAAATQQSRKLGVQAEVLEAKATAKLEPNMRMDIAGAIYFPGDCHLSPSRFMNTMKRLARESGVTLLHNEEVTGFDVKGNSIRTVTTNTGIFGADEFVICGGSWSQGIASQLGLKLPLQAGKGYSLTLEHPRHLPQTCAILAEARVAVTPMGNALRIGGTMEIAGLNEDINPVRVKGIIKSALKYYPDFREEDFNGIPPWRGLRPCTPDGMPYLGRTARFENLSIATGHAMMGLSLGPVTGQLMAETLSGERNSIDISLLSPDRYA